MRFGLSDNEMSLIFEILKKYSAIETVVLYGSRAMNRHRPGSDIDLTLEGEKLDIETVMALKSEFDESKLPYLFDISIRSQIENQNLAEHIERVGKVFYKKSTR